MEPLPENRFDVEIDDDQILFELFALCDQITVLIKNEALPVENQLILAADQVVVCNDDGVVGGAGCQHARAPAALSSMIGRGRNIDNDFRPSGQCLLKDRTVRIPDILANADTDGGLAHLQHRTAVTWLKVTEL